MNGDALSKEDDNDCSQGCDHPDGHHKWEIEPHPHSHAFDTFVCDDDKRALEALHDLVENTWDDMTPGDEKTITIRMNKP